MDFRPPSMVLDQNPSFGKNATNANIYAVFGADSIVTSNGTVETMWWDEDLIDATVTRQFVMTKLRPEEQVRLVEKVGFGELTDDTYLEWIEEKAKRIFLILVDLGVPDQIFGIVDDSWDDDDLPIPLEQVKRLKMTYTKNERLERRFYERQFMYLLRTLEKGQTTFYEDEEIIPLETVDKRPMGTPMSQVDKVHLPGKPDDVLLRRRVALGIGETKMTKEDFLSNIESMKYVQHEHLMSLYAAYIHRNSGYVLMAPLNDSTLKAFLTITPQSFKILAKPERRSLLFNWISCLASALEHLHSKGLAHRKIKPSNVMLDVDSNIFLADCGPFHPSPPPSKSLDKESYDYASPEQWERSSGLSPTTASFSRSNSSRHGSVFSSKSSSRDSVSTSSSGSSVGSNPQIDFSLFGFAAATHLNDPQKTDIFAMGCIFLEILTFFLKRASRNFASHRSSKNKSIGKAGSDSSFHANLAQVDSWIVTLQKDASKKEDQIFRGVAPILQVIQRMMALDPLDRPTASQVSERLHQIMSQSCKMQDIHCGYELGEGTFAQLGIRERQRGNIVTQDPDVMSQSTKSSEGRSKTSGSRKDDAKAKAKAKAWKAPVYAEFSFG